MWIYRIGAWLAAACLGGAAAGQALPAEWNIRAQVAPLFAKLESGQTGSLAIVGDSISFKPDSYNWFLRDRFWADYGSAGDGYLGTGTGFNGQAVHNGVRNGIKVSSSKTGVELGDINFGRTFWGYYTPDGLYSRVWDAGWVQLKFFGPQCRLHYLKQPGGGVMLLTLNDHTLASIPTDGALEHATFDFVTGGGLNTVNTLKITSSDGRVVESCGMDMRTGQPGFVYHRLSRGGSGPRDFNLADLPQNAAILSDLSPDLLIVMLDWVESDERGSFVDDTKQLLDFYAGAMPGTPVILMSHHAFKEDIANEAKWLYKIAQERGTGFIDLYDAIPGGLDQLKAMGFMDGDVHLTAAGGEWFGDYVYAILKQDGTCLAPVVDTQPQDKSVTEGMAASFSVGSGNAASYQWRKNSTNIPGATLATLQIGAASLGDAGLYDCVLRNDCDQTITVAALLTVVADDGKSWWYRDADLDGFGNESEGLFEADQPQGYITPGGDCDDGNAAVHPGAHEVLNGIDDNCDGNIDEGLGQWWYRDIDLDSYGDDGDAQFGVVQPGGYVAAGGDCDDADAAVNPGAVEVLNGIDDDCDGSVDEDFGQWWYRDADGDGFGDNAVALFQIEQPEGYIAAADDCDDTDPEVYFDAPERLNGIDDNCDGRVDEGFETPWYRDADGDGYGDDNDSLLMVEQPDGYIAQAGDCDDADAAVNPGAEEVFDGIDNDCDGETDENVGYVFYRDADGDGFGNANDSIISGGEPDGYVMDSGDCDDGDAAVNPMALEVCDGIDNNCDGNTDENAGPVITQGPAGRTAYIGETVTFSVADTGGAVYQWRKNGVKINGATGPMYQIVNVKQSHAGTYSVRITNPCGETTSGGAVLTVLIPVVPATPSGLKGVESPKAVASLTWTDNASGETLFQVWRQAYVGGIWQGGQIIATLPANTVSFLDSPGDGVWRYRVRAGQGNKYSAWTLFTPVAPAVPTGLKALKVNGSAALSWNDMSAFESLLTIQRQKNVSGVWQTAATLPGQGADATHLTDSPGVGKFRYRMKASNAGGSSVWTVWVSVTL